MKQIYFLILITCYNLIVMSQQTGQWEIIDSMNVARVNHAAIPLENGNILVTGGETVLDGGSITNTCEVYDINTKKWSFINPMNERRAYHDLILLNSGKVIAIGGYCLKTCEIYDPQTDRWEYTDSLNYPRLFGQTSTKLINGDIIVIGGIGVSEQITNIPYLNNCEIFNHKTEKWNETDTLRYRRSNHSTILVEDESVVVIGGQNKNSSLNKCEKFTGRWEEFSSLNIERASFSTLLLPDSNILVLGGQNNLNGMAPWLKSCEIYDPFNDNWQLVGDINFSRSYHTAFMITGKKVLVAAGSQGSEIWEIYDTEEFTTNEYEYFPVSKEQQVLVQLKNGNVISTGGYFWYDDNQGQPVVSITNSCEIFNLSPVSIEKEMLINFNLYQNYPNPFNPSTRIAYSLNKSGNTKLLLYNALGQKIRTLFDKYKSSGSYTYIFDGSQLSSGFYFYVLQQGEYSITRKMLLIK